MAKTLLFYTGIYSFTAEEFINKVNEVPSDEDLIIKFNSPGGSVFAGWGMAYAIAERKGKTTLIVEGVAASMGFILALFADEVHALDVASFMMHQASGWVDNDDDQKILDKVNKDLKDKIKKRVDAVKLKEIAGISVDDVFNAEKRRDIWLTAAEAKKIGLVDKVLRLETKQIEASVKELVAFSDFEEPQGSGEPQGSAEIKPEINNNNNKKVKKMTQEEFKVANPEAYQMIFADGIRAEKDRVGALMAYNTIDPKAVKEAIDSGEAITETFRSNMAVKQMSAMKLEKIESEAAPVTDGSANPPAKPAEVTAEEKEIIDMQNDVSSDLGLTKEKED